MRRGALVAAFIAVAFLLFHPLRDARLYADDFMFVTMSRQLDEPWRLLVQDAFGIFFFRPVGAFFWWLTVDAFGDFYAAQYFVNIALHVGCAAMLFALARELSVRAPAAAVAALVFAAHPTAVSSAAWLSDRFDLLAVFFGLLALVGTQRFLRRPRAAWLAVIVAAMSASMLSKETGFVFPVVALLLLAWREAGDAAPPRARAGLAGAVVATALAVLIVRALALRSGAQSPFLAGGLVVTAWEGTLKWVRYLPAFAAPESGSAAAVLAWRIALGVAAVAGAIALRRIGGERAAARAALAGLAIVALAALAQSPIVRASRLFPYPAADLPPGTTLFDAIVSNRYYYVPLAGLSLAVAAVVGMLPITSRRASIAASVVSLVAIASLLAGSRAAGRDWARFTRTHDAALIAAANDLFASRSWPAGCKVFLLGTRGGSSTFFYSADVIAKSALPRGHSLMGCLVQTEVAPWLHIAEAGKVGSVEPLQVITAGAKPYQPRRIGNLAVYYLRIPDDEAVRRHPAAMFFELDGARFRDVTAEVRDGRRPVRFFDNRPAS